MTFAKLATYVPAAGLVALALYHLSTGDLPGAATAFATAFGLGAAANSGPAPAPPATLPANES
jgi:hypothetical protein